MRSLSFRTKSPNPRMDGSSTIWSCTHFSLSVLERLMLIASSFMRLLLAAHNGALSGPPRRGGPVFSAWFSGAAQRTIRYSRLILIKSSEKHTGVCFHDQPKTKRRTYAILHSAAQILLRHRFARSQHVRLYPQPKGRDYVHRNIPSDREAFLAIIALTDDSRRPNKS